MKILNQISTGIKQKFTFAFGRQKKNVDELAFDRHQRGVDLASNIYRVGLDSKNKRVIATAHRMLRCNGKDNIWVSENLETTTPEGEIRTFHGSGNHFNCKSRLCPSCKANLSRENRRKIRAGINRIKRRYDDDRCKRENLLWRFVTLTMPIQKTKATDSIDLINNAFRLLTNRSFWRDRVRGGAKTIEFTTKLEETENISYRVIETKNYYHVHIHALVLSEFLPRDKSQIEKFQPFIRRQNLSDENLTDVFKSCLIESGVKIKHDDYLHVWVQKVTDYDSAKTDSDGRSVEISLEKAIAETGKYMTKNSDFQDLTDAELLAFAKIKRWNRTFETLGLARQVNVASETPNNNNVKQTNYDDGTARATFLDTRPLSNADRATNQQTSGKKRKTAWSKILNLYSFGDMREFLKRLDAQIEAQIRWKRRHICNLQPQADFHNLDGECFNLESVENEFEERRIDIENQKSLLRIRPQQAVFAVA